MRNYTMRQAVIDKENDELDLSPEQEAQAEVTGLLAKELSAMLLPFMMRNQEAPAEVVGVALVQRAAVHMMAAYEMSPTDFGVFAEEIAKTFQAEAAELRQRSLSVGRA